MMGVIRHKIWFDLWEQKSRTIQVVLIIAIGAFAIGTIMGGAELIREDITHTWQGVTPPMIGLAVDPEADDAILESLEDFENIALVDGWIEQGVQWRLSPEDEWQTTQMVARDDYTDQKLYTVALDSGVWPHRRVMNVERGHDLGAGDYIYLKIEDKEHKVKLGGVIYNGHVAPAGFGGDPTFYTTRERFKQLTDDDGYNTILATLTTPYNEAEATLVADKLQAHLEKQNYDVYSSLNDGNRVANPNDHFIQDELDGIFFILTTLAGISLVLGLFLVYNTITAIITQQVNQIGIMKAVGAGFVQILRIYFGQVFAYALLALLIAVPLGAFGAHGLRVVMVGLFNMEPGAFKILPNIVFVQILVALLSPLIVTIIPIIMGARVTVREAVSTYGLSSGSGLIDRLMTNITFIPKVITLTFGNTFRNKSRVFITQLTLVGSGLVFMMVMHTYASLVHTYSDVIFSIYDFNVRLSFSDAERIDTIEKIISLHPEVTSVEMLGFTDATLRPLNAPETNDDRSVNVGGLPLPTNTYRPHLRGGRWLEPGDTYALVLNQDLARKIGVGVGDWVTMKIPRKGESQWQIVGLFFEPFDEEAVYGSREIVLREARLVGKASVAWVQTIHQDAENEARLAGELRDMLKANGYEPRARNWDTSHQLTDNVLNGGIKIVINLLAAMAVIIAIVGGVALSGVLSINVLERRREIGVMRAVGALSWHIFRLVIFEGLLLGWLSWLLASPLSIYGGQIMTEGLSSIMGGELSYNYSIDGMVYWLGIITILAIIASCLPAWKATRISVRESLAYQ